MLYRSSIPVIETQDHRVREDAFRMEAMEADRRTDEVRRKDREVQDRVSDVHRMMAREDVFQIMKEETVHSVETITVVIEMTAEMRGHKADREDAEMTVILFLHQW